MFQMSQVGQHEGYSARASQHEPRGAGVQGRTSLFWAPNGGFDRQGSRAYRYLAHELPNPVAYPPFMHPGSFTFSFFSNAFLFSISRFSFFLSRFTC